MALRWTAGAMALALAIGGCGEDSDDAAGGAGGGGGSAGGAGAAGGGGGEGGAGGGGGSAGGAGGAGGGGGSAGGAGGGGAPGDLVNPYTPGVPESGLWYVNVSLAEFGNIEIPFQAEIESDAASLRTVRLRATKEGMLSDPLGEAADIAVEDGRFSVSFANVVMPGPFSPTGSDVELSVTFEAVSGTEAFCGRVTGRVESFMTDVLASTFAAVPWGTEGATPPASCEAGNLMIPGIEECPEIHLGRNEAFPSGGMERVFHVAAPEDAAGPLPVLFLYHGLDDEEDPWEPVDDILDYSGLAARAPAEGYLLIAPGSQLGLGSEWESASLRGNRDVVFFDDLLKCAGESFDIDPDRIHVVGHSAGAIHTAFLTMARSEVLASTSGMSAGLVARYTEPATKVPFLLNWGGPEDIAYGQNFDTFAADILSKFVPAGHFVVACNHGELPLPDGDSRHDWRDEGTDWILQFLRDHPRGVAPEPYAGGLPDEFPDLCEIAAGD